jgi:hypothetical protein
MTWATDSILVAGGEYVHTSWSDFQAQAGVSAIITVSAEGPLAYRDPLPWAVLEPLAARLAAEPMPAGQDSAAGPRAER